MRAGKCSSAERVAIARLTARLRQTPILWALRCFQRERTYLFLGGNMQESEVKRVKADPKQKIQRDPSMDAQNRGEEKDAAEPKPLNNEVPIIQRYSE